MPDNENTPVQAGSAGRRAFSYRQLRSEVTNVGIGYWQRRIRGAENTYIVSITRLSDHKQEYVVAISKQGGGNLRLIPALSLQSAVDMANDAVRRLKVYGL